MRSRLLSLLLAGLALQAAACLGPPLSSLPAVLVPASREDAGLTVLEALQRSDRVLWLAAHPDDENSSEGLIVRTKDMSGRLG